MFEILVIALTRLYIKIQLRIKWIAIMYDVPFASVFPPLMSYAVPFISVFPAIASPHSYVQLITPLVVGSVSALTKADARYLAVV